MNNTALPTQTHMGGAQMGNMAFHSPGLHPMNPNMQGGNLQRQPGMMPSQGTTGTEAGLGGVRGSMPQHFPGMNAAGMMNGGASQTSATQGASGTKNFNEEIGNSQSSMPFGNLLMGGG